MCFSFPLLLDNAGSAFVDTLGWMLRGAVGS